MTIETIAEPQGTLTIRTMAMPADTNPAGDIFGGWVMSQMDIAGAIAAVEQAQGRVATVAVEAMTFIAPVKIGDVLCIYTTVERVGNTSVTIGLEAWVRRNRIGDRLKVTDGRFIYVALDDDGRKRPIQHTVAQASA
ncbi:MAG TPA: acyl-CoA thioesterase [Devosiaceae bacterium]|nr:acyl-CoA thioesterase [Devosiaceae bacterium]